MGTNYYVNPDSDSQMEDGSRENPYKSFSKLSQITWEKGDTLFLAGVWNIEGLFLLKE